MGVVWEGSPRLQVGREMVHESLAVWKLHVGLLGAKLQKDISCSKGTICLLGFAVFHFLIPLKSRQRSFIFILDSPPLGPVLSECW